MYVYMYIYIYIYIGVGGRSIVPGGEIILLDEQRRLAGGCRPLAWCSTEVRAAKHRLSERIQLLALVDTAVGHRVRRMRLLRLLFLRICHCQLDIPG